MVDPISPLNAVSGAPWVDWQINPDAVHLRISPPPQEEEEAATTVVTPWQIPTYEITALLQQINPSGVVSLNNLKNFQPRNTREAEILNFLLEQSLFFVLSALDHRPDTLSPQDIRQAATLAADPLKLERQDLPYLPPTPPDTAKRPGLPEEPTPFQKPVIPPFRETPPHTPEPLPLDTPWKIAPQERSSRSPLVPSRDDLQGDVQALAERRLELSRQTDLGLSRLNALIQKPVVTPLKMQEWMVAAGYLRPLTEKREPSPSILPEDPHLEGVLAINPILKHRPTLLGFPQHEADPEYELKGTSRIHRARWSVEDLIRFLHAVSPGGEVTWKQLAGYQPKNDEERLFQDLLRHPPLFALLAKLDGHQDSLSEEDIRQAAVHDHDPQHLSGEDLNHLRNPKKQG